MEVSKAIIGWQRIQICGLIGFVISILSLVPHSLQLPTTHPLHGVVEKVNSYGPYVAIVMAYSQELEVLESSGVFTPRSDVPWIDLSGRRYHIGSIRSFDVIYVMSGQRRLNAGITVQTLLDVFEIRGIVHYGTAGSANDSMSFGDVSVPKFVAFTGSWTWTKFESAKGDVAGLGFGVYNIPAKGENLLEGVEFKREEFFSVNSTMKEVFWLEMNNKWFKAARVLKDLKLQQCINNTYCLPETPKVVLGLRGSTADIFVDNAEYRKFLFNRFKVSTVDEESSAVVMTAMSTGVPVVVFRGVADLAGGDSNWSSTSLSSLAATNALKVAVEFIGVIGNGMLAPCKGVW